MKIAALFGRTDGPQAVERMLDAQRLRPWHTATALAVAGGAAGYVSTSDRFGSVELFRRTEEGNWLVLTGAPFDLGRSLDQKIARCMELPFGAALEGLKELDGAFAAVYWDAASSRLGIVTDILGMQPLHYCHNAERFAIATDAKALTVGGAASHELDPSGWGAFLSMKHPIAGGTLVRGVTRVPPGSVVVYDAASNELALEEYWHWPEMRRESLEAQPVREIVDVFLAELEALREHNTQATLCLSGGFDSRLILAGLAKLSHRPETMSLSHADELFDIDARIASRLARAYGVPFTLHDSDRDFFSSDAYTEYIAANEAATPSLYLFIAQLCSKLKPEMQAVWEGVFPGCILYPVHQPPGGFGPYFARECARLDALPWKAAEQIFRADLVEEMRQAFSARLEQEKSRYQDSEDGVSQFVVRNRTRHRIATNPLQVYSNDVIPLTPGMSKRFWSLAAAIPFGLRTEHRLYQHIFREHFPEAMRVPAVSGTTPYQLGTTLDFDFLLAHAGLIAMQRPKVAAAMRAAGFGETDNYWSPSTLVDKAVRQADTHPDLSAEGVTRLRKSEPPYDPITAKSRELLFYWSSWRRVLKGDLRPADGLADRAVR